MSDVIISVIAGGVSAAAETIVGYPLQYVKTQQQLYSRVSSRTIADAATGRTYTSVANVLRSTVSSFGFLGLYRGMSPLLLFALPRGACRFITYDVVASRLNRCVRNLCVAVECE